MYCSLSIASETAGVLGLWQLCRQDVTVSALASQGARWQGLGVQGRALEAEAVGSRVMDTTLSAEWDSLGRAGSLGLPTLAGLRHHQIGQTPKLVSCRKHHGLLQSPLDFLSSLLIAVLMATQQPKASFRPCRELAGHSAV